MKSFSEMLKSKGGFRRAIYDAVASLDVSTSLKFTSIPEALTQSNTLKKGYINHGLGVTPKIVTTNFIEIDDLANFQFNLLGYDATKITFAYKFVDAADPDNKLNMKFNILY